MNKEKLLSLIEKEFFYEKHFKASEVAFIHPKFPDYEGTTIANEFSEKCNEKLVQDHLSGDYLHSGAISFMYSKAVAYYIGCLMYVALIDEEGFYGDDIVYYVKTHYHEKKLSETLIYMTREQIQVFILFLEYLNRDKSQTFFESDLDLTIPAIKAYLEAFSEQK